MAEPSIFVLGVQKCGTTTVADLLGDQPEIFVPSIKETYFFCDETRFAKGRDWYLKEFYRADAVGQARFLCDATPFYLASPEALQRIAEYTDAEARFVVTLRDPVARAYSAYWHQKRLGNEDLSFEAALEAEESRIAEARAAGGRWWRHAYTEVGRYAGQLERAFQLFGRERVMVLTEGDLKDLKALQDRLRDHLDLLPSDAEPREIRANPSAMPKSRMVQSLVTRKNPIKALARAVLPREMRTKLGRKVLEKNLAAEGYPPMAPETRAALAARFAPEIDMLERLGIGPVAHWKAA